MTQQQQQAAASEEPLSKHPKLSLEQPFPAVSDANAADLRTFMAASIQEYLGQEEATLIDFIYQHVLAQKTPEQLVPDLKQVLDEDADAFLEALFLNKVHELSMQ